MKRGGISRNRLPRIAVAHQTIRYGAQVEYARGFNGLQFFPMQRSGNGRTGKTAQTVGPDYRLRLAIPVDVQEDFALSLIFFDLESERSRVRIDKRLSHGLG